MKRRKNKMTHNKWTLLVAMTLVLLVSLPLGAEPPVAKNFAAHLTGDQEVPLRETHATGQAVFQLSKDGSELSYRLIVANIENVVAAHIHLAAAGVNGQVVAFLAGPFAVAGGHVNGVLATGTITDAHLVGPLDGQSLSVLVEAMGTGGTYVNVHTNDGIDPPNTGPGDFPGGEVRGQIRTNGPQ